MNFSVCSIMYKDAGLERACEEAAAAGLDGVDLWMTPSMCEHLPPRPSAEQLAGVRRTLERNDLALAALTAYYTHSPAKGLGQLLDVLAVARQLDAHCVVTSMVGGTLDITLGEYVEYFSPAVREAERLGVKIAFENHSGQPLTNTTERLAEFAQAFPSPSLGVTIAPAHLATGGCDVEQTIRALGERVLFFYGWDHIVGVDDDGEGRFIWPPVDPAHHFPGGGELPFDRYLAALRETWYESRGGWINIMSHGCEVWPPEEVTSAVKTSRERLSRMI